MVKDLKNFIEQNSPNGGFLQSDEWLNFQESVGRKTFNVSGEEFWANIIEHELPITGKYFYIPRGPVIDTHNPPASTQRGEQSATHNLSNAIINLAKKENAGWVRFDATSEAALELFEQQLPKYEIKKAPHDMQPRELFTIDITKSEEKLLAEMKSKTRYNIKLALKHNVKIIIYSKQQVTCDRSIDEFVRLVKITAKRDKIAPHPDGYYRKMFEAIPEENLKIYAAEYKGKIIAANIVVFFGKVATYLHGASDNDYRNVMAPYLLQWQAIFDAKETGCEKYDFGGIKTESSGAWAGITRFKTGFSTTAKPLKFPGSYDIILNPLRYYLYRFLQLIKSLI